MGSEEVSPFLLRFSLFCFSLFFFGFSLFFFVFLCFFFAFLRLSSFFLRFSLIRLHSPQMLSRIAGKVESRKIDSESPSESHPNMLKATLESHDSNRMILNRPILDSESPIHCH